MFNSQKDDYNSYDLNDSIVYLIEIVTEGSFKLIQIKHGKLNTRQYTIINGGVKSRLQLLPNAPRNPGNWEYEQ